MGIREASTIMPTLLDSFSLLPSQNQTTLVHYFDDVFQIPEHGRPELGVPRSVKAFFPHQDHETSDAGGARGANMGTDLRKAIASLAALIPRSLPFCPLWRPPPFPALPPRHQAIRESFWMKAGANSKMPRANRAHRRQSN